MILRSPYVGIDFLTRSHYKQMTGRAGRAGIDTSGESILVVQKRDKHKVSVWGLLCIEDRWKWVDLQTQFYWFAPKFGSSSTSKFGSQGSFTLSVNDLFGMSTSMLVLYLISWGCNPFLELLTCFIKKSKHFNQNSIASNITTLTLMLSLNWPLKAFVGFWT